MSKELYEAAERGADACLDITEDLGKKEINRRWHVFDELKERLSDAEDEQLTDYWRAGVKKRTK